MFDVSRILAIPDQSIDYLQCGIAGRERAALEARGFIRKDGIKAKDYMIRTIKKTEKNKAKAEKVGIKGDKPMSKEIGKDTKKEESTKTLDKRAEYEAKYGKKKQTETLANTNKKITDFKDLEDAIDQRINSLVNRSGQSASIPPENRELVKSLYDVRSRLSQIRHHKQEILDLYNEGGSVKSVKQGAANRRYIFKGDEKHSGSKENTNGLEAVSDAFKILSRK